MLSRWTWSLLERWLWGSLGSQWVIPLRMLEKAAGMGLRRMGRVPAAFL